MLKQATTVVCIVITSSICIAQQAKEQTEIASRGSLDTRTLQDAGAGQQQVWPPLGGILRAGADYVARPANSLEPDRQLEYAKGRLADLLSSSASERDGVSQVVGQWMNLPLTGSLAGRLDSLASQIQANRTRNNLLTSLDGVSSDTDHDDGEDEDGEAENDADDADTTAGDANMLGRTRVAKVPDLLGPNTNRSSSTGLLSHESVSHESAIEAPPTLRSPGFGPNPRWAAGGDQSEGPAEADDEGPPEDEPSSGASAERSEQEAAEAAEAEAADREALDAQQQQQRQIILAQAQSEAKAVREQQEALLKQQQLQQQMLIRRNQNDLDVSYRRQSPPGASASDHLQARTSQAWRPSPTGFRPRSNDKHQSGRQEPATNYLSELSSRDRAQTANMDRWPPVADTQFSDQTNPLARQERNDHQQGQRAPGAMAGTLDGLERLDEDEMGADYSLNQAQVFKPSTAPPPVQQALGASPSVEQGLFQPQKRPQLGGAGDLLGEAQQHHYGAHYGSLHGHQHGAGKDYYQFVESHKKGQFDSGFKRGNKKFHIAGHSAQHGSHAEGHVKWHGKKGKGVHYWDYKHKGKKAHGHHHYYGGEGHHGFGYH